jgi:Leucine-rich repeat (LRR) protein
MRDTYQVRQDGNRTGKGMPKLAVSSTKNTRSSAGLASTSADTNLVMSANKYQDINDKNKQAHHLLEVVEHGGAFIGRSPESKAYIINKLNQKGFFPGDDRRNYAALTGNKMKMSDGSMVTTGHLDEHQGGVHSKDALSHEVQKHLPTAEQFSQMTDDQVITAILPSAYAGRIDVQTVKGVSNRAIAKQTAQFYRANARAVAEQNMRHPQGVSSRDRARYGDAFSGNEEIQGGGRNALDSRLK